MNLKANKKWQKSCLKFKVNEQYDMLPIKRVPKVIPLKGFAWNAYKWRHIFLLKKDKNKCSIQNISKFRISWLLGTDKYFNIQDMSLECTSEVKN